MKTMFLLFIFLNFRSICFSNNLFQPDLSTLKLELLISSSSDIAPESLFGHLSLRLQFTDKTHGEIDSVITFVANTKNETGTKMLAKGIIGGYETLVEMQRFDDFIEKTVLKESRLIRRFVLSTNSKISANIFRLIDTYLKGETRLGKYTFLDKNCAQSLKNFLVEAGYYIPIKSGLFSLPVMPSAYHTQTFAPSLLALLELTPIKSFSSQISSVFKKIKMQEIKSADVSLKKNYFYDASSLRQVSNKDLNILLLYDLDDYGDLKNNIIQQLKSSNGKKRFSFSELVYVQKYANVLYEMCLDSICTTSWINEFNQIDDIDLKKRFKSNLLSERKRSQELIFFDRLKNTDQFKHSENILKSVSLMQL